MTKAASGSVPCADAPGLPPRSEALDGAVDAAALERPADAVLFCDGYDDVVRWRLGERLEHLFEQRCDLLEAAGQRDHLAVFTRERKLTFRELDEEANRLARHLLDLGIGPGDRVGLLFNRSYRTYVALLAILKLRAAYIPLDPGFPEDRIAYIVGDAGLCAILTHAACGEQLDEIPATLVCLDEAEAAVAAKSSERLSETETGKAPDDLCYIVYTSGSTGHPKGVAIEHPSICNFVKVAGEVYGIRQDDRMYQGMTIAFDFSVEELWVPLIAGATLVPAESESSLVGRDLARFLTEHEVTALCCVPTLLATLEDDLPALRFLLVSGEACPQDLVHRWHRAGRTMLNAYGPTEATVTATWTALHPDRPATIGQPLPTYSAVILDEANGTALPRGKRGEICIAGIGLAKGYVNRDDLTAKCFVDDFLDIPNNPSRRIYRTGDLGRINADGEIEFLGRIDTQVKIRGYRIELTEIESVFLAFSDIAQAVVDVYAPEPGATPELVAYYTLKHGVAELATAELAQVLRRRLPGYMIPSYVEELPIIPMLPSGKADRKQLPPPTGPRFVSRSGDYIAPRDEVEAVLADALVDALKLERVSVVDHFFDDLGAHSLLMAQFCSKIRDRLADADVSMRDVYLHPTVERLAAHQSSKPAAEAVAENPETYRVPTVREYWTCGAFQLAFFAAYGLFAISIGKIGFSAVASAETLAERYVASVVFALLVLSAPIALAIAAKWLLVGRWKAESFPVWSLRYFRFWVVKELVQLNTAALFRETPLFGVYLRLLGAKVGKNAVVNLKLVPVCTDLISIGANTVVRKDSLALGYTARGNVIHTGRVTIGSDAYVGVGSILEIDTRMEDGAQLGHSSSLWPGQMVPAGKRYHGTPARETDSNYRVVDTGRPSTLRQVFFSVMQVALYACMLGPAGILLMEYVFSFLAQDGLTLIAAVKLLSVTTWLFVGLFFLQLLIVALVPRLLGFTLRQGRVYRLFGARYLALKTLELTSNSRFLNLVFGDSSAIVHYLKRVVGYDLRGIVQTGSNFGIEQRHEIPFLCSVGPETMVSDGISLINVQMSHTSFRVSRANIGARTYLGNNIHYPPDAKTGDNCLLATKVMVPVDGPVRRDVGLLGSPPFEIPRIVERDRSFGLTDAELRAVGLPRKNRHNCITTFQFLGSQLLYMYGTLLSVVLAHDLHPRLDLFAWLLAGSVWMIVSVVYFAFVERLILRFRRMKPLSVSIYDAEYWRVERYWKNAENGLAAVFRGTPFKNMISRMQGVRLGKRVFDDGCYIAERTLVEIGDFATLNESSTLQCHSLEEGVFKCDNTRLGDGVTVGINAFVHYGVDMGDNTVLAADSFLMKGETVEADGVWGGNPARQLSPSAIRTPATAAARSR